MLALAEVAKVILATFVLVLILDTLLRGVPGFDAPATRYNLVHALLNTYVVVAVVPDCYFVLTNPLEAMSAPYSDVPLATTIGLHLFHCVSQYKTLTAVDWAHHLVSNMLVSFLCFPFDCAHRAADSLRLSSRDEWVSPRSLPRRRAADAVGPLLHLRLPWRRRLLLAHSRQAQSHPVLHREAAQPPAQLVDPLPWDPLL